MNKNNKKNKGFTILEILISIVIFSLLSVIVFSNLSKFHNSEALKSETEDVVSLLSEARNDTIASKNSNTYGVHFLPDRAILFTGATYSSDPSNKEIDFDSAVIIPTTGGINLNGGGNDVIFNRITGETNNYGTIIISNRDDATQQKTISINKLGVIGSN